MERIQKQYLEIVKAHREAQMLALSEEWMNIQHRQQRPINFDSLGKSKDRAVLSSSSSRDNSRERHSRDSSRYRSGNVPTSSPLSLRSSRKPQNVDFSDLHPRDASHSFQPAYPDLPQNGSDGKSPRKIVPRMGTRMDQGKWLLNSDIVSKLKKIRNHAFSERQVQSALKNSKTDKTDLRIYGQENVYCTLQRENSRVQYETLQFNSGRQQNNLTRTLNRITSSPSSRTYSEETSFYHCLDPEITRQDQSKPVGASKERRLHKGVIGNEASHQNGRESRNHHHYSSTHIYVNSRRTSHSDLEQPDYSSCGEKDFTTGMKDWNSDGDREGVQSGSPFDDPLGQVHHPRIHPTEQKRMLEACQFFKGIGVPPPAPLPAFPGGWSGPYHQQYVDVMYTNEENLQHTIMLQQNLFQQQLMASGFLRFNPVRFQFIYIAPEAQHQTCFYPVIYIALHPMAVCGSANVCRQHDTLRLLSLPPDARMQR